MKTRIITARGPQTVYFLHPCVQIRAWGTKQVYAKSTQFEAGLGKWAHDDKPWPLRKEAIAIGKFRRVQAILGKFKKTGWRWELLTTQESTDNFNPYVALSPWQVLVQANSSGVADMRRLKIHALSRNERKSILLRHTGHVCPVLESENRACVCFFSEFWKAYTHARTRTHTLSIHRVCFFGNWMQSFEFHLGYLILPQTIWVLDCNVLGSFCNHLANPCFVSSILF